MSNLYSDSEQPKGGVKKKKLKDVLKTVVEDKQSTAAKKKSKQKLNENQFQETQTTFYNRTPEGE